MVLSTMTAPQAGAGRSEEGQAPTTFEPAEARREEIALDAVLEDPKAFEGREIVVEGAFRGWRGRCPGSTPITRSDWVLENQTGCIYATGRIPDRVSLLEPRGQQLIVSGEVGVGRDGKPVLKVIEVKSLPKPPR
jgi:hypothetical protein